MFHYLGCVLTVLLLAGCDLQSLMKSMSPESETRQAQQYIEDVRLRNFAPVEAKFDPAYRGNALRTGLEQMAAFLPREAPKSVKLVGSNTVELQGSTSYNLTFEMEFPHRWVLTNVYLRKIGNTETIEGIHAYPLADSLEKINAVTLRGKPPGYYAMIGLAVAVPLFIVFTLIAAIRTPIPKRKWLWIVFILFGVGQLMFNWTTGQMNFNLFGAQLLGAGYLQDFYGPMLLQIGLPLGAFIFWMRRPGWLELAEAPEGFAANRP